jgi:hypothetical protein
MYFFFIPLFLYLRHYNKSYFCIYENNNIERFDNIIKNNKQNILRENILRENILRENILREKMLRENILREKMLRENILREKISEQNKYYSILERLIDDNYSENRKINLIEKNINKYFNFNNINNGTVTHYKSKILNKLKLTLTLLIEKKIKK